VQGPQGSSRKLLPIATWHLTRPTERKSNWQETYNEKLSDKRQQLNSRNAI